MWRPSSLFSYFPRAELSPPRHYAPEQAPAMNFETYCSNERLEPPPCPPQP
ncbi:unnamed protein product, partial [Callosobruchus maculatus]